MITNNYLMDIGRDSTRFDSTCEPVSNSAVYRSLYCLYFLFVFLVRGNCLSGVNRPTGVRGKNRQTGVLSRVKPAPKPTNIQWVEPVGQSSEQSIGLWHVYQHTDEWYATKWTLSRRRIGNV